MNCTRHLSLILFSGSMLCFSMAAKGVESSESQFEHAFNESCTEVARTLRSKRALSWYDISPFVSPGERLAAMATPGDLGYLRSQAKGKCSSLALVILAKMAKNEDAREVLQSLAMDDHAIALQAVSYAEPQIIKTIAEHIIRDSKGQSKTKVMPLLAATGDAETLKWFREMLRNQANRFPSLSAAVAILERRIALPDESQRIWQDALLVLWQANSQAPNYVNGRDYISPAKVLQERGIEIPVELLALQIKNKDMVAIYLAGLRREAALVDSLSQVAGCLGRSRYELGVIWSLAAIGGKDAFKAIAEQMAPGNRNNVDIAHTLTSCPSPHGAALLEELIKDERYRESWPAYRKELELIKAKLQAKGTPTQREELHK